MTAYFMYKCRRCGELFSANDCSMALATSQLIHAMSKAALPGPPLMQAHKCSNGWFIGDLIGYRLEKDAEDRADGHEN